MVVKYSETRSQAETIRQFILQFPNARVPIRHTITRNYQKYLEFGKSGNRNKDNCGRHRTGRPQLKIAAVRQAPQNDLAVDAILYHK